MERIVIENVSHWFAEVQALAGVDLVVEPGEFVAIVGPSGCGKSTLLSCIAGIIRPSAGRVWIGEERVESIRRDVGYVTQVDYLLPWRTLLGNVVLPLELRGVERGAAEERARGLLRRAGLEGFEERLPRELSGGMRQRANIVRTLVYEPRVLLLDEPFGSLDAMTRVVMQEVLGELLRGVAKTCLLVTHDIREAVGLAERIVVMSRRPGRVLEVVRVEKRSAQSRVECEEHIWGLLRREVVGDAVA
jgi:NitT/TauT family transport system ATP-binding protein